MDLDESDYVTICRMLKISSYLDSNGESKEERLWETGDLLVKMAEQIRDLRKEHEPI